MSDEKMDLFEFKKRMKDMGLTDRDINDILDKTESTVHMLTFRLDKKGELISDLNGTYAFVSPKFPGTVKEGETWICSLEEKTRSYHATPICKVTPTLLMSLDPSMRNELIDSLWKQNKKMFEADFADRYKNDVYNQAIEKTRSEMQEIINNLNEKVSTLQNRLEQNRILSLTPTQPNDNEMMIELSSEIDTTDTIELGSEYDVKIEQRIQVPEIPSNIRNAAPGIPEMRTPEMKSAEPKTIIYDVTRTGEETIFSDSFTKPKYFVHISPDCSMLVIRPNNFGSAICINRRIRLKGLGKLSPFTEQKKLMAEYNNKYEGMIVYL